MTMVKLLACAIIFFVLGYISANADLFTNDESSIEHITEPSTSNTVLLEKKTRPQDPVITVDQESIEKPQEDERVEKLEQELARVLEQIEQIKSEDSASNYYENSNNSDNINNQENQFQTPEEQSKRSMTADLASIEEYLPEPFSSIMLDSPDEIKQQFEQMNSESDDYDWAILMEQQIGDFVVLHELSAFIDAFVVKCNAGICELRGFEKQDNAWRKVMMDAEVQPWWKFRNTSSRTTNNEEYGLYFYVMASTSP